MDFSNFKMSHALKIAGLALVVIIVLVVAFRLISSSFNSFNPINKLSGISYGGTASYDMAESYADESLGYGANNLVKLSTRNIAPDPGPMPPSDGGFTSGNDAEDFEVTEYSAQIETRHLENDCAKIANLKAREDVIFENNNEYDQGCSYSFKVKRESVSEIVLLIESLNPKDLSENTFTIKKQIEDFTSETEILEKQLVSINDTLENAITAYDDITALATKTQDIESLAKIIDSKINIIERLTQSRINTTVQLERLNRAKAEQLDRLEYTYFYVNIFENKFIDGEELKDSWKAAIKNFVRDANGIAQDVTVNLITLLLLILQYILYLVIILVVAKYGWRVAKLIWQK